MTERNDAFDDMLDDVYGEFEMSMLSFRASDILYQCDPIAYRVFVSDFEDEEEEG